MSGAKRKLNYWCEGDKVRRLLIVPSGLTVDQLLDFIRRKHNRDDLTCVAVESGILSQEDSFDEYYKPDLCFLFLARPTFLSPPPKIAQGLGATMTQTAHRQPASAVPAPPPPPVAPAQRHSAEWFQVFTNTSYGSLVGGHRMQINMDASLENARRSVMEQLPGRPPCANWVSLFGSGGRPFLGGILAEVAGQEPHFLYVVVPLNV
jgi:hypothetical protein